ncbi:hypothetical protein ACQ5SO_05420 [Rhodovulum sp. DZ06]|uniref:hypothetical protein n=1 Tax=Rhodovulum sp. DZ06 TaxID=3425126 RepID=UPI003D347506
MSLLHRRTGPDAADAPRAARRDAKKDKARLRRSRRRALRFNLALFFALVGVAMLALRTERAGEFLAGNGDAAGRAVEMATGILRNADPDAATAEPVFALRGRIQDRMARCFRLTASSRPARLEALPGVLVVRVGTARSPALEMDLSALKAAGVSGGWITRRPGMGLDDAQLSGLAAQAGIAVYAPGSPCPQVRPRG